VTESLQHTSSATAMQQQRSVKGVSISVMLSSSGAGHDAPSKRDRNPAVQQAVHFRSLYHIL
jgi:hypothetical protein